MTSSLPNGFDAQRAEKLLATAKLGQTAQARIDVVSERLLGHPYQVNPLAGSAESPEVFTVSLESFDCVTFLETVVAFAQAGNTAEFLDQLRRIRYASGKIQWNRRNHYMTEWIRNNVKAGSIARIPNLKGSRIKNRLLNIVPGFAARRMRFASVPKNELLHRGEKLQTGDLIFFVSTRSHLDVFHCGIIIKNDSRLMLRHASRSRGAVVEQKLEEFLKSNRMAGVIVVRPAEIS